LFRRFKDRRDFIVHREPENVNATISVSAEVKLNATVTIGATVIRANGAVEQGVGSTAASDTSFTQKAPPSSDAQQRSAKDDQTFYFLDSDWRAKPAVQYVRDFLNLIEGVVDEAENQFLK
jgi:hypothetical protein